MEFKMVDGFSFGKDSPSYPKHRKHSRQRAGSRITYMIGGALINGLEQLKKAMTETGAKASDGQNGSGIRLP
jgi:hypothetical protein